jgi:hypothetical protein
MDKLRTKNPAHYEKVQAIINGLGSRGHGEVPRWLRTNFDAKDVSYSDILLVTHPPQRDLSFVLEKTTYRARVTLEGSGAKVYPVRNQ